MAVENSWRKKSKLQTSLSGDGMMGYHYQIENAGKYHINPRSIYNNSYGKFDKLAWEQYNNYYSLNYNIFYNKWLMLLPRRF